MRKNSFIAAIFVPVNHFYTEEIDAAPVLR